MNISYNNEFVGKRYSARRSVIRKKNLTEKIFSILSFIIFVIKEVTANETFIMVTKVLFSLSCLTGLISVVHFINVGVLTALPAIIISLALLAAVAFTFRGEE